MTDLNGLGIVVLLAVAALFLCDIARAINDEPSEGTTSPPAGVQTSTGNCLSKKPKRSSARHSRTRSGRSKVLPAAHKNKPVVRKAKKGKVK